MRLPGFVHQKGKPFLSRVIETKNGSPYGHDEFINAFNIDPTPPPFNLVYAGPGKPMTDWDRKLVESALEKVPGEEYLDWLNTGMALHSTGWKQAFKIWIKWSKSCSNKYNKNDANTKWKSFSTEKNNVITLGTLYHRAKENGWKWPPH